MAFELIIMICGGIWNGMRWCCIHPIKGSCCLCCFVILWTYRRSYPLIRSNILSVYFSPRLARVREYLPNFIIASARKVDRCLCPKVKKALQNVSLISFSRQTLNGVKSMMERDIEDAPIIPEPRPLRQFSDLLSVKHQLSQKVVIIAAFTERNNILGERPDVGEITEICEEMEKDRVDFIVIYGGVPANMSSNSLFNAAYTKLTRSQQKLRRLMDEDRSSLSREI